MKALDYCSSLDVVHRDLKLPNILINKYHVIKLADFGLATIKPNANMQSFCGSLGMMAPEILEYYIKHKHSH